MQAWGTMRATSQPWRRSYADQNAGKEGQQWQGECSAEAATAVGGSGRGGRLRPTAPGPGGEQDVGVHPLTQPAEPGEPPRNPRRRQAPEGLRQGQGDHVRDEQAPRRTLDDVDPDFLVVVLWRQPVVRFGGIKQSHPPPGTMPSSTAALVAWVASSTRSFFSLTSTLVAPPTRITATPPASFASRSCNFSRS